MAVTAGIWVKITAGDVFNLFQAGLRKERGRRDG
jgi:hypothetical protein